MARSNGGITGKINKASFGKCKVTTKTSTGTITTQPGTRLVQTLVIAGGGSGDLVSMDTVAFADMELVNGVSMSTIVSINGVLTGN